MKPPEPRRLPARSTRRPRRARLLVAALTSYSALAACAPGGTGDPAAQSEYAAILHEVAVPPRLAAGEAAFNAHCAVCHGTRALGTEQGPPLVHIVYEPSHHSDLAFFIAVERGVRAHHWHFGDMPPQPGVDREQVAEIVAYVRFLQEQVGIR